MQVQRDGWSVADGDVVVLSRNEHNTPSVRRAAEVVALDAVLPALMGAA